MAREIDDDFAANSLTLAEVLVVPARVRKLAQAQAALDELGVQELPFRADSAEKLALLRADTGLRMPDCCVLPAAEVASAAIASFDGRLMHAARARDVVTVQR